MRNIVKGFYQQTLIIEKEMDINVPENWGELDIHRAIQDTADADAAVDMLCAAGWDIDIGEPNSSYQAVEVELPYDVYAGRYEGDDLNCKYSNAFATMDEALAAFDKRKGYPWQRLEYKGRILMGVEP